MGVEVAAVVAPVAHRELCDGRAPRRVGGYGGGPGDEEVRLAVLHLGRHGGIVALPEPDADALRTRAHHDEVSAAA